MLKLVSRPEEALAAIRKLNTILPGEPDLAGRLGQAHAFYVLEEEGSTPLFGFSKFIGYRNLDGPTYLKHYKELDGRNTEHALLPWFDEVRFGSPVYRELFDQLTTWMAQYGKRPREGEVHKTRIKLLKPEFRAPSSMGEDRRILNLLIAVADTLPISQRHELRAHL